MNWLEIFLQEIVKLLCQGQMTSSGTQIDLTEEEASRKLMANIRTVI